MGYKKYIDAVETPQVGANGDPAWWATCRKMFEAGASIRDISRKFGRTRRTVELVISDPVLRMRERERSRRIHRLNPKDDPRERKGRDISRIIPAAESIMDMCRAFAAGRITREQLSKHLRQGPQA